MNERWVTLDEDHVCAFGVRESGKRKLDTICALLERKSPADALVKAIDQTEDIARQHAKGNTEVLCLKPTLAELIVNNPEFFVALCEEGVLEWVKPFVMRKTAEAIK